MKENKNLKYYCKNAQEDYISTPVSVLRYIAELEEELKKRKYPEWLDLSDLEFALQMSIEVNKLEGVKYLTEKIRPHSATPLKLAKKWIDEKINNL